MKLLRQVVSVGKHDLRHYPKRWAAAVGGALLSLVAYGSYVSSSSSSQPAEDDGEDGLRLPPPPDVSGQIPKVADAHGSAPTDHRQSTPDKIRKVTVPKPTVHPRPTPAPSQTPTPRPPPVAKGNSALVLYLLAQVGKPYIWGGEGPIGFDCSGLVQTSFARIGVHLARTSEDQSLEGVRVSMDELQVGDLLFWGSPGTATHVAIYIGGGRYVAAENRLVGVVEYSIDFYRPDFARRVL